MGLGGVGSRPWRAMKRGNSSDCILFWLQSRSGWVPGVVRGSASGVLTRWAGRRTGVDLQGWADPIGPLPGGGEPPQEPAGQFPRAQEGFGGEVRCLIVTDVLDAGGLDELAAFLARRLPGKGIEVSVAKTGAAGGRLSAALQAEGVAVRDTPDSTSLADAISHFAPQVISAHAPPDWALEAARRQRVPVVETLHGLPTPIGTNWSREPQRSALVTSFVAVSETVRRQYIRGNTTFPQDRITVIPNGVNDHYRPLVDRAEARRWLGLDREFLFVSMARVTLQKNTYGLVAAFADLARDVPDVHLLLAGRVEETLYARHVLGLRESLPAGIAGRIHLRDNTPFVSAVLAAGDCYVMDSFFEGWSLASMEGLAAGLPVVISDVGGAKEQVGGQGERGFVVANPLGDPEEARWPAAGRAKFADQPNRKELVARMREVSRERQRWATARAALAEESRQRFSAERCVAGHASVLTAASQLRAG